MDSKDISFDCSNLTHRWGSVGVTLFLNESWWQQKNTTSCRYHKRLTRATFPQQNHETELRSDSSATFPFPYAKPVLTQQWAVHCSAIPDYKDTRPFTAECFGAGLLPIFLPACESLQAASPLCSHVTGRVSAARPLHTQYCTRYSSFLFMQAVSRVSLLLFRIEHITLCCWHGLFCLCVSSRE